MTRRMSGRAGRIAAALAPLLTLVLVVSLGGCDGDRSRAGSWEAVVEGPGSAPAAAVLILQAEGVESVDGVGGVMAWSHEPPSEPGMLRVLLVAPDGEGTLAFRVRVARRDTPAPVGTVLELSGRDDLPLPVSPEHRVRIRSGP